MSRRWIRAAGAALAAQLVASVAVAGDALIRKGEYIFHAAGCLTCHTKEKDGAPLAGGRRLETPLGVFYSPNITPDPDTGIGRWSDEDFRRALRHGVAPDGSHYYPSFPYTSYTLLKDDDLRALKAYLFSRPPVKQANEAHVLPWYIGPRFLVGAWKALFFQPGPFQPRADKPASWNRGAYLVNAAGHCAECHTERNRFGALKQDVLFAGTKNGPEGAIVPNITPHRETGIGRWRKCDLVTYFELGMTPEGDFAGDLMAEVIDNGLKHLTKADHEAMAEYLLSLPPIEHRVGKQQKEKQEKKREFDEY